MNRHDVVVVGCGPVGLLMAIELSIGGANVLVLERLATPSLISKALAVGPLGIEALQRRGMAAALDQAEAQSNAAIAAFTGSQGPPRQGRKSKFSGHFGGLMIRRDAQREPDRHSLPVDQQAVEAMLAARASALGVDVRRGCEVNRITDHVDEVEIEWSSNYGAQLARCAWIVACDGGRSTIRKMAGFAFPGTPPTMTMYTALCDIDHPARLPAGFGRTDEGMFFYGPFPRRLGILDFRGPPQDRQAPVTREEIETVLQRVSGADVRIGPVESAGRWADNTRLVDTYRRGRVFLAGDAAHIHSPFGGQGMSLGLVDAANLGWKLAAVVRGDAPETLLDSYTAERRPVAQAVLANTLAQAAVMRTDSRSSALRDLLGGLMKYDDVNRDLGEMISGLAHNYDLGSDQADVGRLLGDRSLDSESLYDLMQNGAGVFLDGSGTEKASAMIATFSKQIAYVGMDTGPSMLIRPDACIAWVSEGHDTDGLSEALRLWFG